MIVSRTPYRISFFGGGTDYPAWYREHGGAVLATTIDKYCYISIRKLPPFFEHKHRIVYSKIECVKKVDEIQHPAVRAVLQEMKVREGLEIHHDGDLPARSGIASSSSFTVGLLHTLRALQGNICSKRELASQAIHIEQNVIQEAVGSQDQVSAAYGGLNLIEFREDDSFTVAPLILTRQRIDDFHSHLMLFFTGLSRNAPQQAQATIENMKNRRSELLEFRRMVNEGTQILQSRTTPLADFGKLLHDAWQIKRKLSDKVTTSEIDSMYEAARDAGALGGKLLGAGGGGFLLVFARPENQPAIRKKLSKLLHVSFQLERSGSKIVLYDPEYQAANDRAED